MDAQVTSTATIGFNEISPQRNRSSGNGREYVVYGTDALALFSLQHAIDRAMLRIRTALLRDASASNGEDVDRDSPTNDRQRDDINLRGFDNGSKAF